MADNDLLKKWLKRQFLDIEVGDDAEATRLCRLDLVHTIEGEGFEKLESIRVNDDSDIERIAEEIYSAAAHDSDTRTSGQTQRYSVLAFRDSSERALHESSYAFIIRSNQAKLLIGGDSEPPTDKGVTAHYMRHDENMHRLMLQGSEALFGRIGSELQRETARRIEAEARNDKLKEREEELLDRKLERELQRANALQQSRFFAELAGLVTTVAPLVLGRLLAGKEAVMAPNARDLAIQKFLKSLGQEEVKGVLGSLKPPQQIALMEIYQSYAESEAKAEAKKEEILRDGPQKIEEENQQEARQEAQ
jgi:hypothetical protein